MASPQQSPGVYWVKTDSLMSADSVEIRYRLLRDPDQPAGPVVVLLGGFMCPDTWFHYLTPALMDAGYGVLMLHYRGIATSGMPAVLDATSISIEAFAGDVVDVIHAAGVTDVALLGHSMGGQVMTEVYRRLGDRVTAMIYMTATYRAPTRDLFGAGHVWRPAVSQTLKPLRLAADRLRQQPVRNIFRALPMLPTIRLLTAMGPKTPDAVFDSYVHHFMSKPDSYILAVVDALNRHDAGDLLEHITAPTLVICGDADPFTPLAVAERMAERIPDAELVVVPDTTHGVIIEEPEHVNATVLDFLVRARTSGTVTR